jgi:putative FmdB family regulatory protein
MPLYDYRCRECDQTFELRRAIAEADREVTCPCGHASVIRLLPAFAATGRASAGSGSGSAGTFGSFAPTPSAGGGCCGGSCGCG